MAENILQQIIKRKTQEIAHNQVVVPIKELEKSAEFLRKCFSFSEYICSDNYSGIIAEYKRKSPSRGVINANVSLKEVVLGYQSAKASAISVLTDTDFFGGRNEDLVEARQLLKIPLLRKDFIISEYQIIEAKSIGADAILLIAAALEPNTLKSLAAFAQQLGLEVLMEVHDAEELKNNINEYLNVVGVNNRNLKDFSESIETSIMLSELIPNNYVKISESSISKAETIIQLKAYGYKGFLIGETFMKQANPGLALQKIREEIEMLSAKK